MYSQTDRIFPARNAIREIHFLKGLGRKTPKIIQTGTVTGHSGPRLLRLVSAKRPDSTKLRRVWKIKHLCFVDVVVLRFTLFSRFLRELVLTTAFHHLVLLGVFTKSQSM